MVEVRVVGRVGMLWVGRRGVVVIRERRGGEWSSEWG